MTDQPQVSIIIPTYNHASFLREALQSVVFQTFTEWEVIVVNNYSQDDTVEVVECFHDSRISLVNFSNRGIIGASRNRGIEQARGDWIAFLDSDDTWYPRKLECCLAACDDNADLVAHNLVFIKDGRQLGIRKCGPESALRYKASLYSGLCRLTTSAVVVRKQALLAVGGFSEDPNFATAEDYDLWLKLFRQGARCRIIDDVLADYHLHGCNASGSVRRHMASGLAVVEAHFAAMPVRPASFYFWLRKSKSIFYYGAARQFQKTGDYWEALQFYWKGIRTFPFSVKPYIRVCQVFWGVTGKRFSRRVES